MLIGEYIEELLESGLGRIIFAIDGATQEVQSKYRIGSDLEKIKNNIKKLTEEKRKKKAKWPREIVIQTVVTRYNEDQIPQLIEMAKELGVDKIKFKTLAIHLGPGFLKEESYHKEFLPKNKNYWRKGQENLICPFLWETVILWNGDVSICCNDYYGEYIAGNILKENSFEKVVYGKKYNWFRKKILKKELPICKNCPITGEYWIPEISRAFHLK